MKHRDDLPTWINVGPDFAPREKRRGFRIAPEVYAGLMIAIQFAAVIAVQYGLIRLALYMWDATP